MSRSLSLSSRHGVTRPVTPFSCALLSLVLLAGCAADLGSAFIDSDATGLAPQTLGDILSLQERLAANPNDAAAALSLAFSYLQAQRETADPTYFERANAVTAPLAASDPSGTDVLLIKGMIASARHDFQLALNLGEEIVAIRPENAAYWGLLADAQIELGLYDQAVTSLQKMSDLRPDSALLTRVAYLREIEGDVPGAIEAMEQAIDSGTRSPEHFAWSVSELARLLSPSRPEDAAKLYERALEAYPDYAPALAGLSRLALQRGDLEAAASGALRAFTVLPLPDYALQVARVAERRGDTKTRDSYAKLVDIGYRQIALSGTDVDFEHARAMVELGGDPQLILNTAQQAVGDRPTIFSSDVLGLALLRVGRTTEALAIHEQALRTGTTDAVILAHHALIQAATGDTRSARTTLDRALESDPRVLSLLPVADEKALAALL